MWVYENKNRMKGGEKEGRNEGGGETKQNKPNTKQNKNKTRTSEYSVNEGWRVGMVTRW